jgi:probable F420-dependent oxidoreductase
MEFGVQLPNYGPISGPEIIAGAAQCAERLGYDSVWVNDHVIVPAAMTNYCRIFESITTLGWVAAHTQRIRLGTSVLILAQRDAVLAAKQLATVDVLSRGRVIVGLGAGYVAEEFALLGAPYEGRGARLEQQIATMRSLWRGDTSLTTSATTFEDVAFGPLPAQGADIPLWLAGTSERALARAARHADAWHPAHITPDRFKTRGARLAELADGRHITATLKLRAFIARAGGTQTLSSAEQRRGDAELAGSPQEIRDQLKAYEQAGLETLVVVFPHRSEAEYERDLEEFADAVAAALR